MDNLGFSGAASNPYLDKSVNDSLAATTRAYNNTTAPAYTSAMVRSGSFGNSGLEQAQNESARTYQDTMGKQANDMYSNNYQFGQSQAQQQNQFGRTLDQQHNQFGRSLDQSNSQFNLNFDRGTYNDSFSQNQTNLGNAFNLMGMQNQGNQQNLGFGTQIQNAPMNYYQGFANTANSIGNGFGSSQGTSRAPGSPLMGALGGAQIGSQFARQFGGGGGSSSPIANTNYYDPYQASVSGGFDPQGL